MSRILIFDGAPQASQDDLAGFGCPTNRQMFEAALRLHDPDIACTTLNIADGERLPAGVTETDFDGVVITGSPLNVYDPVPAVTRQIEYARRLLAAGLPVWGSCWGLQLGVVALGGIVRRNPKGREIGIARAIALTADGRGHPLFGGKPAFFDALCSHEDEAETLPDGAHVLASNKFSAVQAIDVSSDGANFVGVQYHPEHSFAVTAAILDARRARLAAEGFARTPEDLDPLIADLRALEADPSRHDVAWRYGIGAEVLDPPLRTAEIGNWLRDRVWPRVGRRAAAA